MSVKNRFGFCILICLIVFSLCFSGCAKDPGKTVQTANPDSDERPVLRVLTDQTYRNDHESWLLLSNWANKFMVENNVIVKIEEIPTKNNEPEQFKQRVKSEIMSGDGPDIMIMQSKFSPSESDTQERSPLFEDVALAMRNGIFYDISEFYDEDGDFTAGLDEAIMNAGVLGDARYVLPLRWDIPVIYVDKAAFDASGLSRDVFDYNFLDLVNSFVSIEDDLLEDNFFLKGYGGYFDFNYLPELIDYENGKLTLTRDDMKALVDALVSHTNRRFEGIKRLGDKLPDVMYADFGSYLYFETFWADFGHIMSFDNLECAIETLAIANNRGIELEMYPMHGIDGSVIADITFWGAVGSNCQNPELAYKFLRELLTEDFQWANLRDKSKNTPWYLPAPGWPVRVENSVSAMAELMFERSGEVLNKHGLVIDGITDEKIPILKTKIDKARFPLVYEGQFEHDLFQTAYGMKGEIDWDKFVDKWMSTLQAHVDEG